ncbi:MULTISPECIES: glucosaminidase domain-containing protein [unclassified Aureispira]|uniref:glucosaminidase domain-containing protein n=1 Tax=unclassified Aureispira TaxID=2649989 RepID=UPI0006983BAC|nr:MULTISPECIES: glucosaminidase domain-containing protein [unclassified Aureispira]WMX14096.1 glucosaminidase domain-containing protein [Aureispira sp. CCB-E]
MTLRPILLLAIPLLLVNNVVVGSTPITSTKLLTSEDYAPLAEKYIKEHYSLAVAEMERTSIPASITLAQGMLESGYGTSELAKHANNHFGIKCHKGWVGETYTHRSSENANGSMIARKSCFRSYGTVEESYADHSDFLASRSNYSELFLANTTDYKFWAEGLLKGGYATDPSYANKLMTTIENYNLNKYDKHTNTILAFNNSTEELEYKEDLHALKRRIQTLESILSQTELYKLELKECLSAKQQEVTNLKVKQEDLRRQLNEKISILDNNLAVQYDMIANLQRRLQRVENIQQDMIKSDPLMGYFNADGTPKNQVRVFPVRQMNNEGIFYQSGRKATIASKDRNLFEIAEEYNISFKDLLRYNDLENDSDLPDGYYVFIEPKANYVKNQTAPHQVAIGETIHTISQRYGIKASKLYQRNHLKKGDEPKSGEFIFLNKTSEKQPKLKETPTQNNFDSKFGGGGTRGK